MHHLIITLATLLIAATAAALPGGQADEPVTYTAFAVSTGGPRTDPVASQVDITIERWSRESERQRLVDALKEGGQDALLDALQDLEPVGRIRSPASLGYDLRYAHEMPGEDGGRRIFIATDRPIGYWEAVNRPRTIDYPFTFIELRLNDEGEGQGKLSLATRVISAADGRFLQLENWATQPVMLNQVRRR